MFEDFDFETKKKTEGKSKTSFTNKSSNKSKNKFDNIIGKYTLDIWGKDFKATPLEYNPENVKQSKIAVITFPVKNMKLDDTEKAKFKKLLEKLKKEGYKLRVLCDHINPIKDIIFEVFSLKDIYFITPWKSYCKSKFIQYLPTDANIRLALRYVKNYHKLPGAVKAIMAAVVTTLVGLKNNEPATYVITYDKNYKNGEFSFKLSPDASNYYMLTKKLSFSIINLADNSV